PVPHSHPVSPARELTPERQSTSAEPLVFGPVPRPAGYVDPDVFKPILFGPQPRPSDFVDPDLEEPVIFGPPPRPDNYIEPADIDNLVSMEDDTIHGGFHQESPVRPDDAPTLTADVAGRAEDPTLLTSLSAKLDKCMGRIDSLETELGTTKKIMGGAILTLVSRVKKLERTIHSCDSIVLYNFGVSACTARQMVLSSPWLTANKESGSPLQTALVCNSNPLMVARVDMVINPPWNLPFLGAKGLTSPEQTATGKGISNPLMAIMVCQKPYGIQLTNCKSKIWTQLGYDNID
ncbi:hypothetical protein Tco_0960750, partial [Tanacetum coccineum]